MRAPRQCCTMAPTRMGCGWSHTRNTFSWLTRPNPLAVACVRGASGAQRGQGSHRAGGQGASCGPGAARQAAIARAAWFLQKLPVASQPEPLQPNRPPALSQQRHGQPSPGPAQACAPTHLQGVERLAHVPVRGEDRRLQAVGRVGHALRLAHSHQPRQDVFVAQLGVPVLGQAGGRVGAAAAGVWAAKAAAAGSTRRLLGKQGQRQ